MITQQQISFYRENGFVTVEGVLSPAEVQGLRDATDRMVEAARGLTAHDETYDLEDTHHPDAPRVRRIKMPHLRDDAYGRLIAQPNVVAALQPLIGKEIRFDTSKLNLKSAGYGAAVEWHQDWAFYPHTNDDLCAVGFMLDDWRWRTAPCSASRQPQGPGPRPPRRRPLLRRDGSVRSGRVDFSKARPHRPRRLHHFHHVRPCTAPPRTLSNQSRRLLLYQYRAADAWPLLNFQPRLDEYDALMFGEPTLEPRLIPVPVRMPLPRRRHQGSIYENQKAVAGAISRRNASRPTRCRVSTAASTFDRSRAAVTRRQERREASYWDKDPTRPGWHG